MICCIYIYMFQPSWPPSPPGSGGFSYSPCGMGDGLMNRLYRGAPGSCLLHRSFWGGMTLGEGGGGPSGPGAGTYIYICIYVYIYICIYIYMWACSICFSSKLCICTAPPEQINGAKISSPKSGTMVLGATNPRPAPV